jgi:pyruvate,water dikinase
MEFVRWFDTIHLADTPLVGGKGANLGELTAAGLPVPPGFVVTSEAYRHAIEEAGVGPGLARVLGEARPDDPSALAEAAAESQDLVRQVPLPDDLRAAVLDAYHRLGDRTSVAVRSSGTMEDAAGTSFAGMNATFTNVRGDEDVLDAVRGCWASVYGARVIAYRAANAVDAVPSLGVVVQEMVPSERSGVMFTADPSTGGTDRIVIEAAMGQGEVVVSGQVEPDTYVLRKDGPTLLHTRVGHQTRSIVRGPDCADLTVTLSPEEGRRRVLTDDEVVELARLGQSVEDHYGSPQDIEWAMVGGTIFLVQSRPITTLAPDAGPGPGPEEPVGERVLVQGLAASPGRAIGAVRVLRSVEEGGGLLAGEVLVASMTSPDWVPTMRRAGALVTDGGGMTCHAAIVARELGLPCIVGARDATTVLRDGETVTVDGVRGVVLEGRVEDRRSDGASAPSGTAAAARAQGGSVVGEIPTATKLYVNLAFAERAEEVADLDVDGVGLLRAEFLVTEALGGVHPRLLLQRGEQGTVPSSTAASTSVPTSSRRSRAGRSSSRRRATR